MAMAKPINSLQFIFLNHLSSHEKIFIKVTPSQCSVCIRSLIVSAALCTDCDSDWMAATNCCWRLGKIWSHFVPSVLHPAIAWQQRVHWCDTMMASPLTSSDAWDSAVVTGIGWPGSGGHCLGGVDPRMATPHVLGVQSNNMWWEMFSKRQLSWKSVQCRDVGVSHKSVNFDLLCCMERGIGMHTDAAQHSTVI